MSDLLGSERTTYVDNFYRSIDTASYLLSQQTEICGTLQTNRKGLPPEITSQKIQKSKIIGKMKNNIKVIKWMDT